MAAYKGQYELVRPIGRGSYGEVFLVLHVVEQRHYVMKEIASLASMDDKQRESTELEVKLLSSISHPNIVGFRDSFMNEEGHLNIFMEYCEQGDLHTYLLDAKKTGATPGEGTFLEWLVQIILALQALHARKVLHRDLKVQNIFLTGSRVQNAFALKLGDFGVAKVLNSTTELAMTQIGTPFYMSPELFNNKPYGYKSDIWGLGCVFYEVVNGQRPFEAQSINGLAMKVLQGRFTPITASCSEECKRIMQSMLTNNPAHRPTLQELLCTPCVRRSIQPALQTVAAAAPPEAATDAILTQQLASLGLGGLVDCQVAAGPRKDRRQLQQRLERAERRRKREEDTLRRLQETAGLLSQCLMGTATPSHPSGIMPLSLLTSRPPDLDLTNDVGFSAHSAVERCGPNTVHQAVEADEDPPPMSHRDRVLQRKERRREEESQKFEEEARKIREENLAYQRTWMQDSHRARAASSSQQLWQPSQPQHVLPQLPIGNSSHCSPLSPLLKYDHIKPENVANPFQSCHPNVVNTPQEGQRRSRFPSEPKPPRPQFGQEPPPPHEARHPTSSRWSHSHWSRSDAGQPVQTSRSLHSVCLDALSSDGFERLPEHSEDSGPECSPNGSDDGFVDVGRRSGFANDEQVRRHSLAVQQRIEACRAAICRHKMTIETLQYSCAEAGQDTSEQPLVCGAQYGAEIVPQLRERAATEPVFSHQEARRGGGPPAVVLDRIARLKRRCLEGLGDELFQATRQCLEGLQDDGQVAETVRNAMLNKLGAEKIGFYSLIDQIVYMECRWGHNDAAPPELA